jgi:hypothetical protein
MPSPKTKDGSDARCFPHIIIYQEDIEYEDE